MTPRYSNICEGRGTKRSTPNFDMVYNYQNKYIKVSIIKKKSVANKNGVSLGGEHEGYDMTSCTVLFVGESVWKELSASIFTLKGVGFFYLSTEVQNNISYPLRQRAEY